jgi:hypothetical protein
MTWELYEVWSIDIDDGYEELIDTTQSLKEAREIAAGEVAWVIYREDADGNLIEIERQGP